MSFNNKTPSSIYNDDLNPLSMSEISDDSKTTIPTVISTRERLKTYGKKGETWNNLIVRILNEYDEMKVYIKEWDDKMVNDGR